MNKVKGKFLALLFCLGITLTTFVVTSEAMADPKLLLLHFDSPSNADFVKTKIAATGKYAEADIDILDILVDGVPTLAVLRGYKCVYSWTGKPFLNDNVATNWGNKLKEYVLWGGGVALFTYAVSDSSPLNSTRMQGGIMEPGYNPLVLTGDHYAGDFTGELDFATAGQGNPILAGVGVGDFIYGGNIAYIKPTLDPGAMLVAKDMDGVPLIGMSASGKVVAINVYPGPFLTKTDAVFLTIANACNAIEIISTAVTLVDFSGDADRNGVNLEWETASETDNAGFNIWRSTGDAGKFTKINESLISAEGGDTWGADYSFTDSDVASGQTYQYQLQDVEFDGDSTMNGPISVTTNSRRASLRGAKN